MVILEIGWVDGGEDGNEEPEGGSLAVTITVTVAMFLEPVPRRFLLDKEACGVTEFVAVRAFRGIMFEGTVVVMVLCRLVSVL